ncbi:hypothetical protein DFH07DRAFT_70191 [Mycena maculata]|uniref:Uncharacterized protein n=1 Tax=Mycena maculata TaxID=230809 RepID=A0AAD7ICX8_9AGAR|nr:hypothetical protein DFH07DRAFT_70191 [Mycena maculata]
MFTFWGLFPHNPVLPWSGGVVYNTPAAAQSLGLTDERHYRRFRSRLSQRIGRSRPSWAHSEALTVLRHVGIVCGLLLLKALHDDGGTETPHRRRGRKSSRQRGMSKVLHDDEGTEAPMFSRAGRGQKSSCSLGQSEVLVVSGHRKSSSSDAIAM